MKYLTVNALQRYSGGIDLSQLSTDEINQAIMTAEGLIDAFCLTEHQPRSWHQMTHWLPTGATFPIVAWPAPIVTVDNVAIQMGQVTSGGQLVINSILPSGAFVDNQFGQISIISYTPTSSTSTQPPYLVTWGNPPPIAVFDYHTSWAIPVYGESLYGQMDGVTFWGSKPFWLASYTTGVNVSPYIQPPAPPNIYISGVLQSSGYSIDYTNGAVVFTSPPSGTVTADYTSSVPDPIREGARLTAIQILAEANPNRAGMAGFTSLSLQGQLSGTRMGPQEGGLTPQIQKLLTPYKHVGMD